MTANQDLIDSWALEYRVGGIPSSVRTTPSGSVVWAVGEMRRRSQPLRAAADIGCGKGRNSIYLAEQGMHVTAMDFTPDAIRQLSIDAPQHGVADKIRALLHDVTEDWPVAPESMDLVIDAFCFKHITPHEQRQGYKQNLLRALRSRGHLMVSFASIGDGYYGQYVIDKNTVNGEEEHLVADPVNGIQSTLFTRHGVMAFFGPQMVLAGELHHKKPSEMHGKEYERETYALLLQRNPHQLFY